MYLNNLNIRWIIFFGLLSLIVYACLPSVFFSTQDIYFMSYLGNFGKYVTSMTTRLIFLILNLLCLSGFLLIKKEQYSKFNYINTIHSLGIQLLFNQVFTLIYFFSSPTTHYFSFISSLYISTIIILMVFYSQHLKTTLSKISLNILIILIGFLVFFIYQSNIIYLIMNCFWGLAVILMFNYSPTYEESFHMNELSTKTKVFKIYSFGIFLFFILLFVLPILNHFNVIHYHIGIISYIISWFAWVSLLTVFKIMFYGNHFNIRKENHRFTKSFYIIAYFYIRIRALFINHMNTYEKPIDLYPYLSIGSLPTIRKGRYQEDVNIINLAWEGDNKQEQTIGFPLVDLVVPTKEQAITIAQKIHELIEHKKHVYVHCALGMFRTIFITGTYLVLYENKKPEEVLDFFMAYPIDEHIKKYLNKKRDLFLNLFKEIALQKSLSQIK